MNSYAEAMMIQMVNQRIMNQRCVKCEIDADREVERRQRENSKKKVGLREYLGLLSR